MGVAVDPKRAFQLVVEGALVGCSDCQGVMALCYYHGSGMIHDFGACETNMRKAAELSMKSCEKGSKYGQLARGLLYSGNNCELPDMEANHSQAAAFFSLSASQNLDSALTWLGLSYHTGLGVPQNLFKARRLFQQAAQQGFAHAMFVAPMCT
jgi:TPR repeat protein